MSDYEEPAAIDENILNYDDVKKAKALFIKISNKNLLTKHNIYKLKNILISCTPHLFNSCNRSKIIDNEFLSINII